MEIAQILAFEARVGDFEGDDVGLMVVGLGFVVDFLHLVGHLYLEDSFDDEHRGYDADDSERIGGGIAHRHCVDGFGGVGCLLGGGKSGGVGDGAAHDADEGGDVGVAVDIEYREHYSDVEQNHQNGQTVENYTSFLKRREERGADLKSYREDKEYEAEFADEFQHFGVDRVAEMPHQNTHKQYESDAKRHSRDFYLSEETARGDDEGVEHQGACQRYVSGTEKFKEPIHRMNS